jgi:hypothetical protein
VFRYALERWRPQPYDVVVFHRGVLSKPQRAAANSLAQLSPAANLAVRDVDLDAGADEETQALWKAQTAAQLPWVAARVAGPDRQMHQLWGGPLDSIHFKQLSDSPVRQTIARHLLAGESAVWLLVEGGDRQSDEAAFSRLTSQLKKLEREIPLPALPPNSAPGENLLTDLPLKVSFPAVRLSRDDAAETLFLRMLLFADKGLLESREPIVIPIFGRGRAMGCLVGKDITAEGIAELGAFLAGQCSCEVKEQNPGYDLLMAVDWDGVFREHGAAQVAAQTPAAQTSTPSAPALIPDPPFVAAASLPPDVVAPVARATPAVGNAPRRIVLVAGAGVAGLLVVIFGWFTFRTNAATNSRDET